MNRVHGETVATVRELGAGLGDGQTVRARCPACGGGQSRETSFTVGASGSGLWYRCHRATCGISGRRDGPTRVHAAPAQFEPRPYPFTLAPPDRLNAIWSRLAVPPSERTAATARRIGLFARDYVSSEIVWEFRDYKWLTRGHLSRDYRDKTIRVWRTVDGPFYGYFADFHMREVWIVEDPVSAARIQLEGGSAICLNGTHMSGPLQDELTRYLAFRDMVEPGQRTLFKVALDPDAVQTAINLTYRLTTRGDCDSMWVPLKKDIKDMDPYDLAYLMDPHVGA